MNKASLISLLMVLSLGIKAQALKTHGRFIMGATAVTERYTTNDFGSTSNDVLVASTRYFYKISEHTSDKWEYIFDLRDKYDFFGKLNKTQLQLEPKNEFQVRQLSARMVNPDGAFSTQLGRFQVFESGSTFLDGLLTEYRFTKEWRSGAIGGLNPKDPEKSYLEYNANANQYGVYLTYQARDDNWLQNQYFALAYLKQNYYNQTERSLLFSNFIYQWEADSRLINTVYYDFAPSARPQTVNFLYQQKINVDLSSEFGLLHLDVVEYKRTQNLLEKLPSSAYDEGRVQVEYKITDDDNIAIQLTSGKRQVDLLKKEEVLIGYDMNNRFSKSFDIRTQLGMRNNFTSKDTFVQINLGFYTKDWEYNFDNQFGINKNNDGTTSHPVISDLGVTAYISKQLYASLSFQRAAEETVSITSTFLRLGYRFGNQEIPPVRDGAPPRGAL